MSVTHDLNEGRSPFPLHEDDRDYSGLDIHGAYLADSDALSHSFMNGTTIVDGAFLRVVLDQSELAEAHIERTHFLRCDLNGSDLVRTKVVGTRFEECTFKNGEWRQTEFEHVDFVGCDFTHATINLCIFTDCTFSNRSVATLNHRSINYNIFTRADFDELLTSEYVLSQNFGLQSIGDQRPIVRESSPTLAEVCRLSETPMFRIRDLVAAIEGEADKQAVRANKLALEFMANIVVSLASTRRISPSSMLYIEQIFAQLARTTTSNADFQAAISAVVSIRNAMYDLVTGLRADPLRFEGQGRKITFHFGDDFPEPVGVELARVLGELFFGRPEAVTLTSIRHGSTWMDFLLSASVPVATLAATFGLIFTQAEVIVGKAAQIRDGLKKLAGRKPSETPALVAADPQPERVPAILKSGTVLPELGPVRIAVDRSGKTLILLDNRVEITIHP